MNAIALAALAALLSIGCISTRNATLEARFDKLERENQALRRQNAQLRKGQDEKAEEAPPLINLSPGTRGTGEAGTASVWRERPHGAYLCIADYDAHISVAPKFRFVNMVDDRYGLADAKRTSFVSIEMNGQPVVITKGNGQSLFLAPGESCWLEKGGADTFKIRAKLFKNVGSRQAPVLGPEPAGTLTASALPLFEGTYPLHRDEVTFEFRSHHFGR